MRFKVQGNTLLPQASVDAAVAPYIGPQRDFGDVQAALEALEARYHALGFPTVSVMLPEQVLEKGEVLFKVVEGRIKQLKVSGQIHFDADNIRASLPTLKVGEPPRIDDVSANLRIANENPAKKITMKLNPAEEDDEVYADLQVTDEAPLKLGMTLDNTGSSQTGMTRLGLSFQHANLWNRDHIFTAQYQTSPDQPRNVQVYSLSYRAPLYGLGDAVDFFMTKSNVNSGTISAGALNLAISGRGTTFGTRYNLNLKRQGDYEQQLVFGIDYKAFQNDIGAGAVQLGNDITVHPLSFQYNGRWQRDTTEVSVFGTLMHNLPGGEKGDQAAFTLARAGAPDDYTLLRYGFTASHAYRNDWQVRFNTAGQWTRDRLIPGEQFGMGGSASLRGFGEREISDDRGLLTAFEVYTPELCQPAIGGQNRCRVLAFLDAGLVTRVAPLVGETSHQHVSSTGFGLRYSFGKDVAFQADYGRVLQGSAARATGDWRIHGRLGVFF